MSHNAALDNMECYIEDIVETFEDFVKKSLFIITVTLGALFGLLIYIMRHLSKKPTITRSLMFSEKAHQSSQIDYVPIKQTCNAAISPSQSLTKYDTTSCQHEEQTVQPSNEPITQSVEAHSCQKSPSKTSLKKLTYRKLRPISTASNENVCASESSSRIKTIPCVSKLPNMTAGSNTSSPKPRRANIPRLVKCNSNYKMEKPILTSKSSLPINKKGFYKPEKKASACDLRPRKLSPTPGKGSDNETNQPMNAN